jgi:quercetin dioxygenase-like cupin family protein
MKIVISELPQKEVFNGFLAQMTHTENMTLAFWDIKEGAVLPLHSHVHEQITQVMEGKLQLTIGDETQVYESGSLAIIPSNVVHSGVALTACKVFDIFSPAREDYKQK